MIVRDWDITSYCNLTWDGAFTNIYAIAVCYEVGSGNRCTRFNLNYDTSDTNSWNYPDRQELACHELGHTVGLRHRDAGGCMQTGRDKDLHLWNHDRRHINNNYNP